MLIGLRVGAGQVNFFHLVKAILQALGAYQTGQQAQQKISHFDLFN